MNREELLKSLIKEKYGSVLKFSKETAIPESSLRNIFSRGMDSVSAGTLVEICKRLNVDVESLMDGTLSVRPNPQKDAAWRDFVSQGERSHVSASYPQPLDLSHFRRIPILGRISAGLPLYAEEHIEGYTLTDLNGGAEYFALKVRGDSMNAIGIYEGHTIIVRKQDAVDNGEIAVVLVGDDDATVKRFYATTDTVTLMPQSTNPVHRPQIYDPAKTNIKVLGKVVEVKFSPI